MSRREEFLKNAEKAKNINFGTTSSEKTDSVDITVAELDKKDPKSDPAPVVASNKQKSNPSQDIEVAIAIEDGFTLQIKSKEKRTVPKSFLFYESVNEKFSALAKQSGVSENELINTILKQLFSAEK